VPGDTISRIFGNNTLNVCGVRGLFSRVRNGSFELAYKVY